MIDAHRHTETDEGKDNTQRPKLALAKKSMHIVLMNQIDLNLNLMNHYKKLLNMMILFLVE